MDYQRCMTSEGKTLQSTPVHLRAFTLCTCERHTWTHTYSLAHKHGQCCRDGRKEEEASKGNAWQNIASCLNEKDETFLWKKKKCWKQEERASERERERESRAVFPPQWWEDGEEVIDKRKCKGDQNPRLKERERGESRWVWEPKQLNLLWQIARRLWGTSQIEREGEGEGGWGMREVCPCVTSYTMMERVH